MNDKILVEKSDGVAEPFNPLKLKKSLINSEASVVLANEIAEYVEGKIKDGMTTEEIYRIAFEKLKKTEIKTASRYSLRRSLLGLGPTGFPFEKFIAKILEHKNYKTRVGITLRGTCISHEVDVIASDGDDLMLVEVKFHNSLRMKTDTKVTLYVKARYDDLKEKEYQFFDKKMKPTSGILITNTKFTNNAKKYSKCAGLNLISWDYPKKGNLYDLIEETGLQPITTLVSLSKAEKEKLIVNGLIDCSELKDNIKILQSIGISQSKINKIIKEVEEICVK